MADCMMFPKDWHDFIKDYSFIDSERVYTNGSELIQVLRVTQLIEHLLEEQEEVEPKQIIRKQCKKEHDDGSIDYFAEWYCPHCNLLILRGFDNPSIKFCYKCGKPILWEGR